MLKLIGENGKSIIIKALQEYNHVKVYAYDIAYKNPVLNYYYVDANRYSVQEFCDFVYNDLTELEHTDMVVLYTNLSDISAMETIRRYAELLEGEGLASLVIVTSKKI